jgi:flagellar protein FliO/FliZ
VRPALPALLIILIATTARAEQSNSLGFSFFSSFIQMVAALTVVIGLILLTRHFSDKFMGSAVKARFASKNIRLIETRYLAPKKTLFLVEVGGAYFLLAGSEENLTLIKQVDILEEIEVVERSGSVREGFAGLFRINKRGRKN